MNLREGYKKETEKDVLLININGELWTREDYVQWLEELLDKTQTWLDLSSVLGGKSESEFYYTVEFVNNYIRLDIKNMNTDESIKFIAVQTFDELITEIKRQELLST